MWPHTAQSWGTHVACNCTTCAGYTYCIVYTSIVVQSLYAFYLHVSAYANHLYQALFFVSPKELGLKTTC